jgi:hypothetical protein
MELTGRSVEMDVNYRQFYLWDPTKPFIPPEDWTDEEVNHGLKEAGHFIAVAPPRDGLLCLRVEIHDSEPPLDLTAWDHAVEGSLEIESGVLELREWAGLRRWRFDVTPATYQVRALFGNLAILLVEDEPEADRYLLQVWPGRTSGVRVLKQFRLV